jgi:hypothetical protein
MNDPFVVQQARQWAERLLAGPPQCSEQRIHALYEAAFARPPSADELAAALGFLQRQRGQAEEVQAWMELCHVLINVKEFIFLN